MTQETLHTPAPWQLDAFDETGGYDCMTGAWRIMAGEKTIVAVDQSDYGQPHCKYDFRSVEAEANARLIVTAPEMLEELKALYAKYGWQSTHDLIAKATGAGGETADKVKK